MKPITNWRFSEFAEARNQSHFLSRGDGPCYKLGGFVTQKNLKLAQKTLRLAQETALKLAQAKQPFKRSSLHLSVT